jgi:hypothetical protein
MAGSLTMDGGKIFLFSEHSVNLAKGISSESNETEMSSDTPSFKYKVADLVFGGSGDYQCIGERPTEGTLVFNAVGSVVTH